MMLGTGGVRNQRAASPTTRPRRRSRRRRRAPTTRRPTVVQQHRQRERRQRTALSNVNRRIETVNVSDLLTVVKFSIGHLTCVFRRKPEKVRQLSPLGAKQRDCPSTTPNRLLCTLPSFHRSLPSVELLASVEKMNLRQEQRPHARSSRPAKLLVA